MWVMKQLSN